MFAFANLRLEKTNEVLNRFCELLVDAGMYAVFYYAGHGFEHQNVDYIMPVNAQMPLRCDECYSVNYIAAKLQERKGKVFMFLDSCRVRLGNTTLPLVYKCTVCSTAMILQGYRDQPVLISNYTVPFPTSIKCPHG